MREVRIASAQNAISGKIRANLCLEGLRDINVREDAETLLLQRLDDAFDNGVEIAARGFGDVVIQRRLPRWRLWRRSSVKPIY